MQQLIDQFFQMARSMWRFRWYAIVVAWLVCLGGWYFLSKVPNTYEASATVYVDTDTVLRPLLRGLTVEVDVSEKLGLMTRQLLSRANLERVIQMTDLGHAAMSGREQDELLADIRNRVTLQEMHAVRQRGGRNPDLYVISFRHQSPETARRVVEALVSTFVDDTTGDQRARTDMAQQFLDRQIADYETRLIDAEDRLREFKRRNVDALPDQEANFYARLTAARTNLEAVELSLREANFRRNELRRQLDSTPSTQRGLGLDGAPIQSPTEERLLALETRLDELLLRFTDNHPDVVATRNSIAVLEQQLARETEGGGSSRGRSSVANPLHQQLRMALGEVEAEIAALQVRRDEFRTRVSALQQQIETLPQVEAELQRLDRDYEIVREQYNTLVARRESARISEDVEQAGQDVRFRVIEPPRTPIGPVSPPRAKLSAGILLAGVAAGAGVAFLLMQLFPVVHGRRMLHELTGRPVFGAVSRVWSPAALWKTRIDLAGFALLALLMVPAFGLALYMQITGRSLMAAVAALGGFS